MFNEHNFFAKPRNHNQPQRKTIFVNKNIANYGTVITSCMTNSVVHVPSHPFGVCTVMMLPQLLQN